MRSVHSQSKVGYRGYICVWNVTYARVHCWSNHDVSWILSAADCEGSAGKAVLGCTYLQICCHQPTTYASCNDLLTQVCGELFPSPCSPYNSVKTEWARLPDLFMETVPL